MLVSLITALVALLGALTAFLKQVKELKTAKLTVKDLTDANALLQTELKKMQTAPKAEVPEVKVVQSAVKTRKPRTPKA
jgi:beta-lactam-binding protein with PASTA domain